MSLGTLPNGSQRWKQWCDYYYKSEFTVWTPSHSECILKRDISKENGSVTIFLAKESVSEWYLQKTTNAFQKVFFVSDYERTLHYCPFSHTIADCLYIYTLKHDSMDQYGAGLRMRWCIGLSY